MAVGPGCGRDGDHPDLLGSIWIADVVANQIHPELGMDRSGHEYCLCNSLVDLDAQCHTGVGGIQA